MDLGYCFGADDLYWNSKREEANEMMENELGLLRFFYLGYWLR
jgi:hypothetical protein